MQSQRISPPPAPAALRRLLLLPARLLPAAVQGRAGPTAAGRRRPAAEPPAQTRQRRDPDPERRRLPRRAGLRPGALHAVHRLRRQQAAGGGRRGAAGEGVVGADLVAHRLHRRLPPPPCAQPSDRRIDCSLFFLKLGLNPCLMSLVCNL